MDQLIETRYAAVLAAVLLALPLFASGQDRGRADEERVLREYAEGRNWFLKGGGFRGEHFSTLDEIDSGNVGELGLAWSLTLDEPDGIAATPIVVDGTIFLSAPHSIVYAVDAASGRQLWRYDPGLRGQLGGEQYSSWIARANRGVAVWQGKVYVATANCDLIALDADDGKVAWKKRTCDPALGYGISDSPYVGRDMVFIGNAGSESGKKNRGYVSAYGAADGELRWRFYTVPSANPGENDTAALRMAAKTWSGDALEKFGGGGSNWNEMTYDPESGLLFFGTAGALPYLHRDRSPEGGDSLFTSSVLAVRADTGEYVWHYQTVPEDSWEYNATMNIVLADIDVGGKPRAVLLIAPKNGFFYVLDRLTGELLSAEKFAKVTWATHINLETGRPALDPRGEYWRPGSEGPVMVWPNMWGAHSWNPMAYHPGLGLAYIPVVDLPSIVTPTGDGEFRDTMDLVTEVDGSPHSPGKLIAWDPVRQSARWSVDHRYSGNGGVLATAGKLVFQGSADGYFSAYEAASGELLWRLATGTPINAAPAAYEIDGRQHVVVPVGSGGGMQFNYPAIHGSDMPVGPTRLMAFSLDASELPSAASVPPPPLPEPMAYEADPDIVARGRALFGRNCGGCHGKDAVARFGGSVPDLRYATAETHLTWNGIVIGGARAARGMPAFEIEPADAEAIRSYVLARTDALRGERRGQSAPGRQ